MVDFFVDLTHDLSNYSTHDLTINLTPTHRLWNAFATPNTDTEDTSDECAVGGLGFYSHSSYCLTHQHWVDQVISGGGFGVHCTQSAESIHKLIMHTASLRVLHRDANYTQGRMLQYLLLHSLFEDMKLFDYPAAMPALKMMTYGVRVPLCDMRMGVGFGTVAFQQSFLHPEARIARVEFLDLLCDKFGIPKTRRSYGKLEHLTYALGQKLIRRDGKILWATDSKYTHDVNNRAQRRRDILFIKGEEGVDERLNAFCCESVLFCTVSQLHRAQFDIPATLQQDPNDGGSLTFVLARWFEPHPAAGHTRDSQNRPVCPGPLHINHCLWRYAHSARERRALVTASGTPTAGFRACLSYFGSSESQQTLTFEAEKHAYFGLLSPDNILSRANMCPAFVANTSKLDMNTWLQTVTVL